jgi:hypothetical protein
MDGNGDDGLGWRPGQQTIHHKPVSQQRAERLAQRLDVGVLQAVNGIAERAFIDPRRPRRGEAPAARVGPLLRLAMTAGHARRLVGPAAGRTDRVGDRHDQTARARFADNRPGRLLAHQTTRGVHQIEQAVPNKPRAVPQPRRAPTAAAAAAGVRQEDAGPLRVDHSGALAAPEAPAVAAATTRLRVAV